MLGASSVKWLGGDRVKLAPLWSCTRRWNRPLPGDHKVGAVPVRWRRCCWQMKRHRQSQETVVGFFFSYSRLHDVHVVSVPHCFATEPVSTLTCFITFLCSRSCFLLLWFFCDMIFFYKCSCLPCSCHTQRMLDCHGKCGSWLPKYRHRTLQMCPV